MIDFFFPIVDTHLHVWWDPRILSYPWLNDIPQLNKPFLLEDFSEVCGQIDVDKVVFIQAECDSSQYIQEAEWAYSLAVQDNRLQAIIPWLPLETGDAVRPTLEAFSENSLVKGIRRIIQFEPNPGFCLQSNFIKAIRSLTEFDLHFEICITPIHLENTLKLVRSCQNVRFVLNHIAKPNIKDHIMDSWRQGIKELSAAPNSWCKISGLVTEADHKQWKKEDLKPYIDHVVGCFGFNRIMYGGDCAIVCQATEYTKWIEVLN